jgi:hypothetical protein
MLSFLEQYKCAACQENLNESHLTLISHIVNPNGRMTSKYDVCSRDCLIKLVTKKDVEDNNV